MKNLSDIKRLRDGELGELKTSVNDEIIYREMLETLVASLGEKENIRLKLGKDLASIRLTIKDIKENIRMVKR